MYTHAPVLSYTHAPGLCAVLISRESSFWKWSPYTFLLLLYIHSKNYGTSYKKLTFYVHRTGAGVLCTTDGCAKSKQDSGICSAGRFRTSVGFVE